MLVVTRASQLTRGQNFGFRRAKWLISAQAGLGVRVLDRDLFVSGAARHKVRAAKSATTGPAVFHVNFVEGKAAKLEGLKGLGLWFLPDDCSAEVFEKDPNATRSCLDRAVEGPSRRGFAVKRTPE